MNNSKLFQSIADKIARKEGYYAASYKGHYFEFALYCPIYEDNIPRTEGAPAFILVEKDGVGRFVMDFQNKYMGSFDIIDKGVFEDSWKEGEKIYGEMITRLETGNCSDDERGYLEYLKSLDANNIVPKNFDDLTKETFFTWLEAADRMGDRIVVKTELWDCDRTTEIRYVEIQRMSKSSNG